jgi:hypothetical protein
MSNEILIFKGMKVGILPGDFVISINEEGDQSSKLILSTAYNVVPLWIKIGQDNLNLAKVASSEIATKWSDDADMQKDLLLKELAPAMQVFVSCGIALDALYDTLRPYSKLTQTDLDAWKAKKTARAKQIVEVFRRTHKLKNDTLRDFVACISQIVKYRDMAVHPSTELKNSCVRSDVSVAVDWKFAAYRFSNAELCFNNTVNMIVFMYEHKSGSAEIDDSVSNIVDALEELKVVKRNV